MKNFILIALCTIFCAFSANAQVAKMSSVYTNLKVDCKPESKVEADEVPFICKAVGGFRVRIVPAGAWAEMIEIVDAQNKTAASLGTHGYGYSTAPKRMVEWRMANGKPFAVIFRINEYDQEKASEAGDNPYTEKYKTGEKLIVRGLPGYSQIDFEVDAKEKNANVKAQNLADENFQ
ncbi:MAG: hypothetical protein LUM44_23695 [Pyrinomonadaceae bacterium]|nr:hypothetical protein [Pyrinomonadaceae bacterium]